MQSIVQPCVPPPGRGDGIVIQGKFPCFAVPCFVVPCFVVPCFVVPCFVVPQDLLSTLSMLCFCFRTSRHRSPVSASRSSALVILKSSGCAFASSSQVSGIDTGAPGSPRGE